jgi:uncharacterized membrane protein
VKAEGRREAEGGGILGGGMADSQHAGETPFNAAQVGALAHLYRAEVYRSTAWRVRLDNTTNWAVVTTGIAISASFSSTSASPLPLVLVGLLVVFFLLIEARRFRYFDIWRMRARALETKFYVPILRGREPAPDTVWNMRLAHDYESPRHRMSFAAAVARRLRYNYLWILLIQAVSYYGKLAIHPTPLTNLSELWARAAIGPFPGEIVVAAGVVFHGAWALFALSWFYRERRQRAHLHFTD